MRSGFGKMGKLIGFIMFLQGIGFCVGSFFAAQTSMDIKANGISAEGVVTEIVRTSSKDGYSYYPMVRFNANGEEIEFKHSVGSSSPAFFEGEEVGILYLESAPHEAKIDTFLSFWMLPLILGIMGLVFGGIGFGLTISSAIMAKRRKELLANGRKIYAKIECMDFTSRDKGADYWKIKASWLNPRDNKVYIFYSEAFYYNPQEYTTSTEVLVAINPNNPKKYAMDTSFLPETS